MRCGAAAMIAVMLGGCPWVPVGEIRVVDGPAEPGPGDKVMFALYCDYLFDGNELSSGGPECESGSWGVEDPACDFSCELEGGTVQLGLITECGVYTAPAERPPEPLVIVAGDCGFGCADGCGASLELALTYPP